MLNLFERLEAWPNVSGVKALRGQLAGSYQLRIGDYRLEGEALRDHWPGGA
jgi:mRNA-degrading endonuclease RelE of RelBE toxin-antitoxin system